jgi:protein-tyrosine phosphatase
MSGDASKLELIKGVGIFGIPGYLKYKLRATIRVPDMDQVTDGLWIGGETKNVPLDFKVFNVRDLVEGDYVDSISLIKKVTEITNVIQNGDKVFVHCRHGRGRAPLVAMCYLLAKNVDFTVNDAYTLVKYSRPNIVFNSKQRISLNNFYNQLINIRKVCNR